MKLSDQAMHDLTKTTKARTIRVVHDVLQLVDDPEQAMVMMTYVATSVIGHAARAAMDAYKASTGKDATFEACVHLLLGKIAKAASEIEREIKLPSNLQRENPPR